MENIKKSIEGVKRDYLDKKMELYTKDLYLLKHPDTFSLSDAELKEYNASKRKEQIYLENQYENQLKDLIRQMTEKERLERINEINEEYDNMPKNNLRIKTSPKSYFEKSKRLNQEMELLMTDDELKELEEKRTKKREELAKEQEAYFAENRRREEERIREEELAELERKRLRKLNKKWWQFWI